jgi:hypothetical protein
MIRTMFGLALVPVRGLSTCSAAAPHVPKAINETSIHMQCRFDFTIMVRAVRKNEVDRLNWSSDQHIAAGTANANSR